MSDISLQDLLASDLVDVAVMDLVAQGLLGGADILGGLRDVLGSDLNFEGFDLYDLAGLGMFGLDGLNRIVDFSYDLLNIVDRPIDLGFDLGDVFAMELSSLATVLVTVEAGFEWMIDFDGPTGTEGITFLIDNARVAGRAELTLDNLELAARLGFVELNVGGNAQSSLNLLAEAVITLDEDGDLSTDNDRRFSFTDLVSGGLIDHFLFDFTGYAYAGLVGIEIDPAIPGLDTTGFDSMELSITIPDLLNWDVVEVFAQSELTQAQREQHLAQDHVLIVHPDFDDLFNFRELDFASIIQAIREGVEFIQSALESTSFYEANIPIINQRVSDAFDFIGDLLDKIELAAEDPAAVIQEVEALIEDALGISDTSTFGLELDDAGGRTTLKIHLEWDKVLSDIIGDDYTDLSFALNLGDVLSLFTGGDFGSSWDWVNELVSAGAHLQWDARVEMVLDFGIDFTDILSGDLDFFLYDYDEGTGDGTRIQIGLYINGTDLELMFNPFGIGVVGGSAQLGSLTYSGGSSIDYWTEGATVSDVDYATFTLGIEGQNPGDDDGRFYFVDETLSENWFYELVGGFDIYLPIEIPGFWGLEPVHIYTNNQDYGDTVLLEALDRLFGGAGSGEADAVIVDLPTFTAPDFGLLNILNDPTYILDGIDWALGTVGDALGSSFAQDIPLIGDKLYKAATFLTDIRTGFLADLREKLNGPGKAIEFIRDSMWDVFGPDELNILTDRDDNGRIEAADIGVGWYDADGNRIKDWIEGERVPMAGYIYDADGNYVADSGTPNTGAGQWQLAEDADAIQFEVPLGGVAFGTGIDIPLDIDVPAFALNVDGGFAVELTWSFDLAFGLSVEDGFYLGTNDLSAPADPELEVEIGAFLDGEPLNNATVTPFYAEGKLLFFVISVEDVDRDEGEPGFQPSGVFGFLDLDILGDAETGRVTLNHLITAAVDDLFDIDFGVEATLNTTIVLDIGDVGLPRLEADFIATWSWSLDGGSGEPEFGLYNLRIDIGTFVTDVLKPITDNISDVLDPFRPIVEVFTTEVSGLDVICDPPTLLGLVNLILRTLGYSEIPVEFFNAVRTMIDVVDQVDAMIGREGEIFLGDIMGLGTDNVSARQDSADLPGWLSDFMDELNTGSMGMTASSGNSFSSGGSSTERSGFEILDYLLDISNWMKLITGGDAILFTYELPLFEYTLNFKQDIATITAGPAVIKVSAVGNFEFTADLGFGYDTYGIRKAIDTGNYWYVFDGFYVADWGITSGKEKPEFTVGLEIGLEATLWLLLVEAGLGGVVGFEMGLDLADIPPDDGRIHPTEFAEMWRYTGNDAPGGLLNLINLDGRVYFEAYVFVDVGISIPFIGKIMKRVVDWTIFDITLAEWEYRAPTVEPVLAHAEGDTLVIHSGKLAGDREYLNYEDGGENFTISGNSGSITVAFDDWSQVYTGSFTKVVADGGKGDDKLDASGLSGVAVEFDGGEGKDTLTAGSGAAATLIGGDGNDTLNAANATGAVYIDGGAGDDRITGGTSGAVNTLIGGDGDDRMTGGDGADLFTGGPGLDSLSGMGGNDTYYFENGFGSDSFRDTQGDTIIDLSSITDPLTVTISSSAITILTPNEELRLGQAKVTQLILGTGSDTLLISDPPEGTLEIVDSGGPSTTTFTFGRNTSNKADGIISFVDADEDLDQVILANSAGIEMNSAVDGLDASQDDIIVINDHQIRSGRYSSGTIVNSRDVFQFTDGVEQFTLAGEYSLMEDDAEAVFYPMNLTISSTTGTADLGEASIHITAKNLSIRPATDGGSMHLAAHDIVIAVVEDCVLDTSVHATGKFYIEADSIGAVLSSASPLVRESADSLGTIEHDIDAHDMDWNIRVSSLTVNARINAINDGNIIVLVNTATPADQRSITLNADVTSGSADNDDRLGGGTMRFVAQGDIHLDNGMRFEGAGAHLVLAGDNIFNDHYASSNRIETTVGGITVLTRNEGNPAEGTEIVIEETDSLVVYGLTDLLDPPGADPVGLSSAYGIISVTCEGMVATQESEIARLTLDSGSIITRTAGRDITLTADDFQFWTSAPGREMRHPDREEGGVIGSGELTILTSHATRMLIGTSAEHPAGQRLDLHPRRVSRLPELPRSRGRHLRG